MKQAGGDDFVWLPVSAQQRTNLNRMGDERRAVDLSVLIRVAGRSEPERGPCDWQPAERVAGATRPHGGAARDLWIAIG
jgi:hypothetical protein